MSDCAGAAAGGDPAGIRSTGTPLSFTVGSTTPEIVRARGEVDAYLRSCGANARSLYAAALCVEEALTNVVLHGHQGKPDREITVEVCRVNDGYLIVIEDDAPAFDPTNVPPPPRLVSIAEATVGGRGIAMIRHHARSLRYQRRQGHNRLVMEIGA